MNTLKSIPLVITIALTGLILFYLSRAGSGPNALAPQAPVYDATGSMLESVVYPSYPERIARSAPVYDATGAMINSIVLSSDVRPVQVHAPVYDATAALLDAVVIPSEIKNNQANGPVYDATGAMLDAIRFSHEAERSLAQAPVYDATAAKEQAVVYPKYPDTLPARAATPQPLTSLPTLDLAWATVGLAAIGAAFFITLRQITRRRDCQPG